MKQNIIVILVLISLLGCSTKYSDAKNGAILGGTAGVLAGSVVGAAIVGQKSRGSTSLTQGALVGAFLVGLLGTVTGYSMGYVVDVVKSDDDKIKKIQKFPKIKEIKKVQYPSKKYNNRVKEVIYNKDKIKIIDMPSDVENQKPTEVVKEVIYNKNEIKIIENLSDMVPKKHKSIHDIFEQVSTNAVQKEARKNPDSKDEVY